MMFRVNACPKNQTEVEKAGKILGCGEDIYGHNQYMCLPNKEKTSHYEFCYKGVMGIENGGACLKVSGGQLSRESCAKFDSGCPKNHYWKYDFFKYPACQSINRKDQCYVSDSSCPSEIKGNTESKENSTYENVSYNKSQDFVFLPSIFCALIPITIFGIIIVLVLLKKYKRTEDDEIRHENQENQGLPGSINVLQEQTQTVDAGGNDESEKFFQKGEECGDTCNTNYNKSQTTENGVEQNSIIGQVTTLMTKINHILRFDKRIPQSKDLRIRLKAFWDWTFRMNEKFSSDSTGATVCSTQEREAVNNSGS